jgi:hypothetical protein
VANVSASKARFGGTGQSPGDVKMKLPDIGLLNFLFFLSTTILLPLAYENSPVSGLQFIFQIILSKKYALILLYIFRQIQAPFYSKLYYPFPIKGAYGVLSLHR